jgi:ATP-dependent RNA helicase RhlE
MKFTTFSFHPSVAAGVVAAGYEDPTPIQMQAIPSVMAGRDVMGLAQTGTGKTAAFALPLLHRLMQGPRGVVRALIIAPTRELAEQINDATQLLGRQTRLKSITVYGGVGVNPQIEKLRKGVEIVVACPGRLLDHINQGTIDLSRLELLVLDEADQMFDMGFLPDIRRILAKLPRQRQTLLFSATMPAEIRGLAREILSDPVTVQVDNVAPAATVAHALYPVGQHLKTPLLLELLRHTDTESVLIFTRTKHRAKRVGEQLEKAGYRAASLQGNLSQNRRQAAMEGFRSGSFQILVATDIAARGIDVSQVSHVINYDIPDTTEAYIHRIGRTGRAARSGDAFTMVTDEDTAMVRAIERALGSQLERRTVDGFDYKVPAPRRDEEFARPPRPPRSQPKTAADRHQPRKGTPATGTHHPSTGGVGAAAKQRSGGQRRPR